jgi:hypothetical protein
LIFASLFAVGCVQQYRNIPRVHHNSKHAPYKSNGHWVNTSPSHITVDSLPDDRMHVQPTTQLTKVKSNQSQVTSWPQTKIRKAHDTPSIDSLGLDSVSKYDVDKSLTRGSAGLFVVAAGMNVAFLLTPVYTFMFIGLLIGLGLLVLGYFISKFIENVNDNRIKPKKIRFAADPKRDKLKKAFNISMIVAGSSFTLALITATTGSFSLPFFFFILGMISLWGGLLLGLIYVLMGA